MIVRALIGLLLIVPYVTAFEQEEGSAWAAVGQQAAGSVARVLCYGGEFSWMEPHKGPQPFSCSGTAFFVDGKTLFNDDQDCYLLTNYHVIAGAKAVYLTLTRFGKRRFSVTVRGVCPEWDIALLQLSKEAKECIEHEAGPIKPLVLGDSDMLYPTQPVLAVGYPLGPNLKATSGAVAGRDFLEQALIHITAPVNPGNSGGPLFTKDGKVVGINTAVLTNAQNYNYVVPSNSIITIVPDLYAKTLVRRHKMGMILNRTTESHARLLQNPLPVGAYVNYVFKDSAVQKAGLQKGDMLYEVHINGTVFLVNEDGDVSVPWRKHEKIGLAELFARCRTRDSMALVVFRKGTKLTLRVSLESYSLNPVRKIHPDYEAEETDFEIVAGACFMQLRVNHLEWFYAGKQIDSFFPIKDYFSEKRQNEQVLIVTHLFPGSQADFSRCFVIGSLLDTVNGEVVQSLKDLRKALGKSEQTGTVTLTTKDDYTTVFDVKKIIEDEALLSLQYKYAITPAIKKLMESVKK